MYPCYSHPFWLREFAVLRELADALLVFDATVGVAEDTRGGTITFPSA